MSLNQEIFETLSRLAANGEKKSLAASAPVTPENDKLCASLIERSLAASVKSNNNEAMEIYNSIFG